jgi:WS/DGAT/MGAT family acyltransferase
VERLSPLDAAFLDAEDEDPNASLAIASVAVLDGPAPALEEFTAWIAGRLPLVARYRQRVRQLPFDLAAPLWIDDPGFDIADHVRRVQAPDPGDDVALCDLFASIMSRRLDRAHPLWETWMIEGLADGRWAVLSKVHHCMADGISGNELYRVFCDETPEPGGAVDDDWIPGPQPDGLSLTLDALSELVRSPAEHVRLVALGLSAPKALAKRIADTARGLIRMAGVLMPVTDTSLSGPIGRQRGYAAARADLSGLTGVARAFHVTLNDVALAAITGAYREHLLRSGLEPDADAIRALVPVSVRTAHGRGIIDNRISMMLPLLPVEIADPVDRLAEVHLRLRDLKTGKEAEAGAAMTELAKHEPFALVSAGIRLAARLPQRNIVTVTTNVPGSARPLYILGRRIREILPFVPIAVRLRSGIAILTYAGAVSFGITADVDNGPDPRQMAADIAAELAQLTTAADRVTPALAVVPVVPVAAARPTRGAAAKPRRAAKSAADIAVKTAAKTGGAVAKSQPVRRKRATAAAGPPC